MKSEHPIAVEFFADVDLTPYTMAIFEERKQRLHRIFGPEIGDRYLTDPSILQSFFGIGELWDGWNRPLHYARLWKASKEEREPEA